LLGSNRGNEPAPASKPSVNAGLRILIAGAPQAPDVSANVAIEGPVPLTGETPLPFRKLQPGPLTQILAVGGLASADLALLGWTTHYVVTHQHALNFWGAAGCTGSVLVAALCGTAAMSLIAIPHKK
jgi:hypothetical protein